MKTQLGAVFSVLTSCVLLQVFVWIGNEAQEEEKTEAARSGETDGKSSPHGQTGSLLPPVDTDLHSAAQNKMLTRFSLDTSRRLGSNALNSL